MLYLGRRRGQRIRIGDDVWVTVAKVSNGEVSIGIDAPAETVILREELIKDDKTYAAMKEAKDGK